KPRPAYEAKLRKIHSELVGAKSLVREDSLGYRVTPHHPMITEAVDATLKMIREILHKRAHLSSRSQALDELAKLLFAHVHELRSERSGISRHRYGADSDQCEADWKRVVGSVIRRNLLA